MSIKKVLLVDDKNNLNDIIKETGLAVVRVQSEVAVLKY